MDCENRKTICPAFANITGMCPRHLTGSIVEIRVARGGHDPASLYLAVGVDSKDDRSVSLHMPSGCCRGIVIVSEPLARVA